MLGIVKLRNHRSRAAEWKKRSFVEVEIIKKVKKKLKQRASGFSKEAVRFGILILVVMLMNKWSCYLQILVSYHKFVKAGMLR